MFLTLRATNKGPRAKDGPQMEEIALNNAGPGAGRTGRGQYGASRRPSCLECRTKKLRCTGGGEACARCETQGIPCVFPPSSRRKRARHDSPPKAPGTVPNPDNLAAFDIHRPFPQETATIPVSTAADAISNLSNTVEQPEFASWEAVPDLTNPQLQISNNHLDWTGFLPTDVTNSSASIAQDFSHQPESTSSGTQSHEYEPSPSPSKQCSCISDTLRIVQSLDDDEFHLRSLCFDEVLKLQKWIIFHCLQPLTCQYCAASPSAHTVVLIICERLTEMFTCLSRRLANTHIDASSVITINIPPSPPTEPEDESSSPNANHPTPRLYDAESGQACTRVVCNAAMFSPEFKEQYSDEEQYHMARALAKLQVRNFSQLLSRMGGIAEGNVARVGKIQAMNKRIQEASERMETAFDRILECLMDRATNPSPAA